MSEILNVGCGTKPSGDVNVDLYIEPTFYRSGKTKLNIMNYRNFHQADAAKLPFEDKSFDVVYSSHLLEHVENPAAVLREFVRVAKKQIIIIVPHMYSTAAKGRHYKECMRNGGYNHFFRARYFYKFFEEYGKNIYVTYKPFPHSLLPIIMLPYEIVVTVFLNH